MSRIIHTEIHPFGPVKMVGKAIRTQALSPDIRNLWDECLESGLINRLRASATIALDEATGMMVDYDDRGFTYIVGLCAKDYSYLPNDIHTHSIPACTVLRCQIEGPLETIYADAYHISLKSAKELGYQLDERNHFYAEVYTQERFMKSIEENTGKVILDTLIPVRKI
jgi:predicted transcriptional regulator YdeE